MTSPASDKSEALKFLSSLRTSTMRSLNSMLSLFCAAVALLAMTSSAHAAEEIPWSTNIEASLQQARASGKPVLMEFTASWCVYCKRMEKTTFVDPQVVQTVQQNFVAVRVDADQNKAIVADLAIKGLPAILIVSPDLQIIERISGFQTPEALVPKLQNVARRSATPAQQPVMAANRNPRSVPAQTVAQEQREELEFEAITHEEARPQRRSPLQPVSKPRTVTNEEAPSTKETTTPAADETNQFFEQLQAEQKQTPAKPVASRKPAASAKAASFKGHCLVSAVEDRELVQGSPRVELEYRGHVLHFRTEDQKQQFLAEPARYWPMLDGSCAMTMLDEETKVEGELEYAATFRRRIWLFSSEEKMKEFLLDPSDVVEALAEEQSAEQ